MNPRPVSESPGCADRVRPRIPASARVAASAVGRRRGVGASARVEIDRRVGSRVAFGRDPRRARAAARHHARDQKRDPSHRRPPRYIVARPAVMSMVECYGCPRWGRPPSASIARTTRRRTSCLRAPSIFGFVRLATGSRGRDLVPLPEERECSGKRASPRRERASPPPAAAAPALTEEEFTARRSGNQKEDSQGGTEARRKDEIGGRCPIKRQTTDLPASASPSLPVKNLFGPRRF